MAAVSRAGRSRGGACSTRPHVLRPRSRCVRGWTLGAGAGAARRRGLPGGLRGAAVGRAGQVAHRHGRFGCCGWLTPRLSGLGTRRRARADRPGVGAAWCPRALNRGRLPRLRPGRLRRGDSCRRRCRGPQPGPDPRNAGGLLGPGRSRPPSHPRPARRRELPAGPGPGGRWALATGRAGTGRALAGAAASLHDRGLAPVPSGRGLDRRRRRRWCHRRRRRRLHARARTRGGHRGPGVPRRCRAGGRRGGPGGCAPPAPAPGRGGLLRDAQRPGRGRRQPGAGLGRRALSPAGAA